MIKEYQSILGCKVLDFDDGHLIAMVRDVIIHPDTGKIEAFWVTPFQLSMAYGILQTQDIVEWKRHLYIKNEGAIASPEDVLKIAEILQRQTPVIGNRVRGETGASYGKVYSLDFDTQHYYLRTIYTQKSLLGFSYQKNLFAFDSILEMLPNMILVDDKKKSVKVKVAETLLDDTAVGAPD